MFSSLFHHKKKTESVILIDISASSVAGAYVWYVKDEIPAVLYTRRFPIEMRKDEPQEQAMLRALKVLGDTLIREGAPAFARVSGSGTADAILVSIDAPWQNTSVRTEHIEQKEPFIFSKHLVTELVEKTNPKALGKLLVDESIISTLLNGYETRDPYGKKVLRASVIILTSFIDEHVADRIATTLRSLFHTTRIVPIAGSSLRYQALRIAFPHEHDVLILDTAESFISVALVRKNLFVALAEISSTDDDHRQWVEKVLNEFSVIAKEYPLPRIIFLLARESDISSLQQALGAGNFGELWLSESPPKIIPVLANHIAGLVRQATTAPPDLQLLLMALFYHHRAPKE